MPKATTAIERVTNLADLSEPDRDWLDSRQFADWLGLSKSSVEHFRVTGDGPPFVRVGASIRYSKAAVLKWLESQTYEHTSAYTPKRKTGRPKKNIAEAFRGQSVPPTAPQSPVTPPPIESANYQPWLKKA
jgi:predicted DNA-binding transcriptional regulator AlpA